MSTARRRRIFFTLLALLLIILVPWALGEAAARLFGTYYTMEHLQNQAILYSPSIFGRHMIRREARMIRDIPHPESMAIRINSKGFRGEEFEARKPPGVKRVIFLGGSSVFGYGLLGPGKDWPARVQAELRAAGHHNVECINAGMPGHATFEFLGRIYGELHLYEPDVIVLYEAYNDLAYFHDLTPDNPLIVKFRPKGYGRDPRYDYLGWWDRLLCYSQLYLKLRTRYLTWRHKEIAAIYEGQPKKRYDTFTPEAVRQYRLDVQLICDAARNIGAHCLLVTQARLVTRANLHEADPKMWSYLRLEPRAFLEAYEECDRVLREVAQEKNVHFLDASAAISGRKECFIDVVHLNEEGAAQLASLVAAELSSILSKKRE